MPTFTHFASLFLMLLFTPSLTQAQDSAANKFIIRGQVQDAAGTAVAFANVALYTASDSTLAKVETTGDDGLFRIVDVPGNTYDLVVTYIGAPELRMPGIRVDRDVDVEVLQLSPAGVELAEATVTARRALVEVKPDRTVFNVEGTINAVGNSGLDLLRKAPGVTVDNNDNINVLSRSGVLLYVDGRRMPLSGADLATYLRNLNAEEIDRIDIITNPGARYEAEGNAGIIDIRLKKAEDEGANGSVSVNGSQGRYSQGNVTANGNYRNRWINVFGSAGYANSQWYNVTGLENYQNSLLLDQVVFNSSVNSSPNYRIGADFSVGEKHTLGFLASGRYNDNTGYVRDDVDIFNLATGVETVDSTLAARTDNDSDRSQNAYNLNYRYLPGEGQTLNVDLDFGRYRNDALSEQVNAYTNAAGSPLSSIYYYFDTPIDIDIYTAKADYERTLWGGTLSAGGKFSRVMTENTFLFYDVHPGAPSERTLDEQLSNRFDYTENVYAGYLSYQGKWSDRWQFTAGLRAEITDAEGELMPFLEELREPPVELNYVSFFPNAGLTYSLDAQKGNTLNLAYGRRINRPDYNVLNPFREQISQLTYERGNPFLRPEIVDNLELGYTHAYRYNFKLGYSSTSNQITRLIGPDNEDPRAGYISWDNLASQRVISFNASAPMQLQEKWNLYVNASASHLYNQADYGDGAVIDVKAFTYSFFVQNTINLPWNLVAEIGGYFSGPGVWGGVLRYNEQGALNLGLQRKFLNDQLNVKLSANDILFTSGWTGTSEFNGLRTVGYGNWDSRRVALSLSYSFGNQQVKSRNRRTGLEKEAERLGDGE
ncbi:outer membrane receptor protein involved in Fe transport [Neolewinella xylanilytica]|uniref:Outer membrane receptor protein involved in Fe transport n=1 Tax=Neolewinella xylanilytica TaxID=1514080 RepID=A0A2S6IB30_9BACT|nr:TonB-dependent receptor [Neolewinella xylanilytica]PPK88714.1 outer membrane receptor protein involved in Fe transport [Neolewinella xylanilytica]